MPAERSFTKTLSNNVTEKEGIAFLLASDLRFQKLASPLKNELLRLLGLADRYTNRVFDVVMTPEPLEPLSVETLEDHARSVTLVETKSTKKAIYDRDLGGFFFGATENEYRIAQELRGRYKFAFIVLNSRNLFGTPFFELLDFDELERRTRTKRIQFQVNLKGKVPHFGRRT